MDNDEHMRLKKLGEKTFKGAFKTFKTKTFEMPDGTTADYDVTTAKSGEFAVCVALTSSMEIVISKEFRPGPEKVTYDPPMGESDPGEDINVAVVRELREESGYKPGRIISLNPGGNVVGPYDDKAGYFYLALDCEQVHERELGENEIIETITMPLRQFVNEKLRKGLVCHADGAWAAIDYMLQAKIITLDDIAA